MQDHVRTHAPSGTLVPVGRLRPANGLSGFNGRVYFSRDMKFQANNQNPIPKPGQPVFLWFFRTVRNEPEPVVRQTPESHPPPERAGDERRTTNARWTSHRRVEQSPRRRSGCDRSAPKPSGGLLNRTMRECFLPIEISVAGFGLPGGGVVIALVSLPSSSMTRSNVARPSRASVNVSERVPVQSAATV